MNSEEYDQGFSLGQYDCKYGNPQRYMLEGRDYKIISNNFIIKKGLKLYSFAKGYIEGYNRVAQGEPDYERMPYEN